MHCEFEARGLTASRFEAVSLLVLQVSSHNETPLRCRFTALEWTTQSGSSNEANFEGISTLDNKPWRDTKGERKAAFTSNV